MSVFGKVVDYFTGSVKIYADSSNKRELINFMVREKIDASFIADKENGGVYTELSPKILKKLAPALDKSGIIVYIINIYGFGRFMSRYRNRYGFFIGTVLFFLLLWISTLFVWKIDIEGTELLSKEQVREELKDMGVYSGKLLSDIDRNTVKNIFLSKHPEFSHVSVNFKGTTVSLAVKETETRPDEAPFGFSMLVAKSDGVVRSILVYEGSAAVKEGAVVREGDVLITGMISGSGLQITDTPLLRFGNARGSVKAEVSCKAEVTVPYSETTQRTVNGDRCGIKIEIFGQNLIIGDTSGVESGSKNVTVFGTIELPISFREYRNTVKEDIVTERSATEARCEAEKRIYRLISEKTADADIVSIAVEIKEDESGVTAIADFSYVTEIAVGAEIKGSN